MGSILLDEPVTYTNVPDLRDIRTTFKLLELLGCPNAFENGQVTVTPGALSPEAPYELVKTMRASVLVLGPLLARLGEARVAMPGRLRPSGPALWICTCQPSKRWGRGSILRTGIFSAAAASSTARTSISTFPPSAVRKTCSWQPHWPMRNHP